MKITSIAYLLFASSISAVSGEQDPCHTHFLNLNTACQEEDSEGAMDDCFGKCMEEKHEMDRDNKPACSELSAAVCDCGNECTSNDACKLSMMATINCQLENQLQCGEQACSRADFGLPEEEPQNETEESADETEELADEAEEEADEATEEEPLEEVKEEADEAMEQAME
eukprot:CAMPEP_0172547608 /NCGR_PEP_ID=MMETSP1067-20121228/17097_1 /TAXON_ID=265564 ORGANISM="Thalassiosira punctigera, Strain Tpunct2005C2" /NCGR_SAMPLE_ID=MMETSP1067 /ASSEMBLY_ACC=CAM_ASM_000444 /LENGTH=169 /DNA_ID=CAMNT_0013334717 /DNA_START=51 /DNA_END=560 /DNA_ORIENTATION=+